jgi:hypothetical protein
LPANTLFELQRLVLAALLTAVAAYLNQLWKYSRDAYQARVDETCKLIFDMAEDGAKYWVAAKRKSSRSPSEKSPPSVHDEIAASEVKIDGRLRELQFLRLLLERRTMLRDLDLLRERMATFQDAMTGGDFGAAVRAGDPARARQVYLAACDLVAHIREAADRGNKWWLIALRIIESRLPYRRPTTRGGKIEEMLLLALAGSLFLVGAALCLLEVWHWAIGG